MQTLNEELETSGEELQSSNEQLVVVHHELQDLNAQVQKLLTKFQNLTMQAPVAICIYRGRDFVVEIANDFYLQMVEKDQDFIGKPLFESLPEGKAQGIKTMLDHVLDTGMPFHGTEVELNFPRDKKGAKGFFNFICQPIREKDNSINSIMVVVNEVTDQVIARNKNSEIQQLHARELKEKVRQRTQELLESNEELIKANLELESFTYISSHDLQEPLRKIQTFSKLILEKEHAALSDSGKDYFKRMQSAAARMQQLITDLLAFSHVNSAERNFE